MSVFYFLEGGVIFMLFIYLFVALLKPELFP